MSTHHELSNNINNNDMEIEHHGSESQPTDSTYHMKSVKFHCESCKRNFSIINPENNHGTCPRCDNVSDQLASEPKNNQDEHVQQHPQSPLRPRYNASNSAEPSSTNAPQAAEQNPIQRNSARAPLNFVRQTIFGPGQTIIIDSFSPLRSRAQQQSQSQPQQQRQPQPEAEQNNGGLLAGLGNLLGFGQRNPLQSLIEELFSPEPQPQRRPTVLPNIFGGNPADLFGEVPYQPEPQPQHQHAGPQHIIFGINPFDLVFMPLAGNHIFFNAGGADYERLIEEFLRNDPNSYGAAPAPQDKISSLREFAYESGVCKNVDCTVCQEDYQKCDKLVSLPCGHNYHKDCVTEWLTRHDSCPVCRKSISGEQAPEAQLFQQESSNTMEQERSQPGF